VQTRLLFTVTASCAFYYFSLNDIFAVIAWTFSSTPKSQGGITVITLNLWKVNYIPIRLYMHIGWLNMLVKFYFKIPNDRWKKAKNRRGYFCHTLHSWNWNWNWITTTEISLLQSVAVSTGWPKKVSH